MPSEKTLKTLGILAKAILMEDEKMDAVKFLEEWKRMCETIQYCHECPIKNKCFFSEDEPPEHLDPEEHVQIVSDWSAAHACKTRLQDFLEKYPDAEIDHDENRPFSICAARLGYLRFDDCQNDCAKCWNTPIE